jgi:MFS family permease
MPLHGAMPLYHPLYASSRKRFLPCGGSPTSFRPCTELTSLVYLVYFVGIFLEPTSGRISNRFGSGNTLLGGTVVLGGSLALVMIPAIAAVVRGLLGVCTGFFKIHAAACSGSPTGFRWSLLCNCFKISSFPATCPWCSPFNEIQSTCPVKTERNSRWIKL